MHEQDELSLFVERLEATGAPYMVTGATAAILYGQPRVTNDLGVVLGLDDAFRAALLRAFPETEFYVPPESVIQAEQARPQRGHFNVIHLKSGYKADIYLAGEDPLHAWALPRRRRLAWGGPLEVAVAPPEYVVLRKLEYFREGRSSKHRTDIRAIVEVTGVDESVLAPWLAKLGLSALWQELKSTEKPATTHRLRPVGPKERRQTFDRTPARQARLSPLTGDATLLQWVLSNLSVTFPEGASTVYKAFALHLNRFTLERAGEYAVKLAVDRVLLSSIPAYCELAR